MSDHDFHLHPPAARLLEGCRALVTGATTGIGQGTAFALAAHGAAVAVNHRAKVGEARAMVAAIEAAGGRAVAVEMDVSAEGDVRRGFAEAREAFGGLDLLVNNAGVEKPFAPHGIRIVSIAPGAIAAPINQEVLDDPKQRRRVESEIPLGRWGEVSDVANAVAWVSSEQAQYVVGATIFVDGGMTLYPKFV